MKVYMITYDKSDAIVRLQTSATNDLKRYGAMLSETFILLFFEVSINYVCILRKKIDNIKYKKLVIQIYTRK